MSEHDARDMRGEVFEQAPDGSWRPSVPLPFFHRFTAECGASVPLSVGGSVRCRRRFLWLSRRATNPKRYEAHYRAEHL